jgi:oligosaccharide repeat unit polymerase
MLVTFILCFYVLYCFSWSRRPVMGFFITALAFVYRFKISWRSLGTKSLFISASIIGGAILLLFLGATRGERIYRVAREPVFSKQNLESFIGGITVNYEMCEYHIHVVPEEIDYMYGKGFLTPFLIFIPRAIWPSKPVASDQPINELVFGLDYKTNTGVTIVAEMYQNFGILAPLGMFFIGKFVRGFNRYLRENSDNMVAWISWFMIIVDFATEWRGGFTSMTGSIIIRISFFLGIAWLAGKLFGSGQQVDYGQIQYEYEGNESDYYHKGSVLE